MTRTRRKQSKTNSRKGTRRSAYLDNWLGDLLKKIYVLDSLSPDDKFLNSVLVQQYTKRNPEATAYTREYLAGRVLEDELEAYLGESASYSSDPVGWREILFLKAYYFQRDRSVQLAYDEPATVKIIADKLADDEFLAKLVSKRLGLKSTDTSSLKDLRKEVFTWYDDSSVVAKIPVDTGNLYPAHQQGLRKFRERLERHGALQYSQPMPLMATDDSNKSDEIIEPASVSDTNEQNNELDHPIGLAEPASSDSLQPTDVTEHIAAPSRPTETENVLDLYFNILTPASYYLPDEWQRILELARSSQHLIIEGNAGSGKTILIQILGWQLRSDWVPVHVKLSQYAVYARDMDIVRFVVTRGPFSEAYRDEALQDKLISKLAELDRAGQLIILADHADDLMEDEIREVSQRLDNIKRLIIAERTARLLLDRTRSTIVQMPRLSIQSQMKLLETVAASSTVSASIINDLHAAGVELNPGLLMAVADIARKDVTLHPVLILDHWVDQLIKRARSTGIIDEQSKLRRILRLLAGIRCNLILHPVQTADLVRENVRRCFWDVPLQPENEGQGWALIDLGVRAGLLVRTRDTWRFTHSSLERFFAAEMLYEEGARVSLRVQHQPVMKWVAALTARFGTEQYQYSLFERLRAAIDESTLLSALDAAELLIEFNGFESSASRKFKMTVSQWFKALATIESAHLRHILRARADALDIDLDLWRTEYIAAPLIVLAPNARNLAELLNDLRVPHAYRTDSEWLADKRVLDELIEHLKSGDNYERRLQCAAWLQHADLSKPISAGLRMIQRRKSLSRSALEAIAHLASDHESDNSTRALAKSVLARDEFILALWGLGEEFRPVVYDLLLTIGKRLYRVRSTIDSNEWKLLD